MTPPEKFVGLLHEKGWQEVRPFEYRKGEWALVFDTSSWLEVGTKSNPRVFDVSVPDDHRADWTVNLIEHLCRSEDERFRLRSALDQILQSPTCGALERSIVERAI
jgi:hypothetical protein